MHLEFPKYTAFDVHFEIRNLIDIKSVILDAVIVKPLSSKCVEVPIFLNRIDSYRFYKVTDPTIIFKTFFSPFSNR